MGQETEAGLSDIYMEIAVEIKEQWQVQSVTIILIIISTMGVIPIRCART
jgi:hypothetical protein